MALKGDDSKRHAFTICILIGSVGPMTNSAPSLDNRCPPRLGRFKPVIRKPLSGKGNKGFS
jgi:hypothetical protein